MADPRIQTIGTIPVESGVADVLFKQFEEKRVGEAKLKHAGALAGIESKHRMAEQENANKLAIGMENLRNQLTIQRSQEAFQREQTLRQQAATYLETQIGGDVQRGVPMPGLTTPTMGTPEAGIAGTPAVTPIQPGAVDIARGIHGRNVGAELDRIAQQRGLSMEVEKKQLFESMDLMTDEDARDAANMASQFTAVGDGSMAKYIKAFATPGQGSRTAWQKVKTDALPKMLQAAASNDTRLKIAYEVTARNKEVQRLRGETQKLLALPRLGEAEYKRLKVHHDALKSQHDGLSDAHRRMGERAFMDDPAADAKNRTDMRQIELTMQDLRNEMTQVSNKLGGYAPGTTPAVPQSTPGSGWGKAEKVK